MVAVVQMNIEQKPDNRRMRKARIEKEEQELIDEFENLEKPERENSEGDCRT